MLSCKTILSKPVNEWWKTVFFFKDTLERLALEEIDQSNAVLFIHYDPDTKMIYLAGKASFIHITVDYINFILVLEL